MVYDDHTQRCSTICWSFLSYTLSQYLPNLKITPTMIMVYDDHTQRCSTVCLGFLSYTLSQYLPNLKITPTMIMMIMITMKGVALFAWVFYHTRYLSICQIWKSHPQWPWFIMITLKGTVPDFYNFFTAPRTVSNTYAQAARAQLCTNHTQHTERLSRATCHMPLGFATYAKMASLILHSPVNKLYKLQMKELGRKVCM